jgi:hypothetical protein
MRVDPADAAVAVRSFPRRWHQATTRDRAEIVRPQLDALADQASAALRQVARDLGLPASGSLDEVGPALAAAIESAGPDRWRDDDSVDTLSRAVDAAGSAIRQAERLVEDTD